MTQFTLSPEDYIDSHVHVWTDDFKSYPLAAGFTQQEMQPSTFFPEDILRHARPCGVTRIVLIQMSYYGFDNSYMLDVIRQSPDAFRGVAVVNWQACDADRMMREMAQHGVRGFRIYPEDGAPERWLDGPGLDKMFRYGAASRLAICLLVNPDDLAEVQRRCELFPETPVVVDHLAQIGAVGQITESDTKNLCALARYPEVKVKVSAFYALGEKRPPHLDLVPLIRRVYEAFGPRRLMWASDCPFQLMGERYEDSISVVRDQLGFMSGDERAWVLGRTAEETFFS